MQKANYEMEILVKGNPIKEYLHDSKIYVEGREETIFSLRLKNNSGERKLFVPSIDGLSVMNGEECGFDSGGYIVRPYGAITVEGWRVSDKEVAKFYFSSPEDSYGERIKKGNNLGVIGAAVFAEEEERGWVKARGTFPNRKGQDFVNYCLSGVSQNLGTGWGEAGRSEVVAVNFQRKETPEVVFEIYYNTRGQLEKMGVNFKEAVYVAQAFPGRYCRPPERK